MVTKAVVMNRIERVSHNMWARVLDNSVPRIQSLNIVEATKLPFPEDLLVNAASLFIMYILMNYLQNINTMVRSKLDG